MNNAGKFKIYVDVDDEKITRIVFRQNETEKYFDVTRKLNEKTEEQLVTTRKQHMKTGERLVKSKGRLKKTEKYYSRKSKEDLKTKSV